MSSTYDERPAPALAGNRPQETCRLGQRDSLHICEAHPLTQARLHAEKAWAKIHKRPFEVVRVTRN